MLLDDLGTKKIFDFSLSRSPYALVEEKGIFILIDFLPRCNLIVMENIPYSLTFTHISLTKNDAIVCKKTNETNAEHPGK